MKDSFRLLLVSIFSLILLSSLYYTNFMFARGDDDDDDDDDDDFSDKDVIEICCTWGYELADGVLTYSINTDDDDDELMDSVRGAVATWNSELTGIRLVEADDDSKEDIKISFENDGRKIAGKTVNYFDQFGFLRQSEVIVSQESYDRDFDSSQIEQITLHELGHVLGLDHANFRGNLMAERVDLGSTSISSCEIQAVNIANSWKLDGGNTMYLPEEKYIEC
jgi:Matrixin